MEKEVICFENLIKILQIFLFISDKEYYLQNANNKMLRRYIFLLSLKSINDVSDVLQRIVMMNLIGHYNNRFNLDKIYLKGINLKNINLSNTHMMQCCLEGAHLEDAYLEKTHLESTNLTKAIFDPIILKNVILENTKISIKRKDEIAALEIDINKITWCD